MRRECADEITDELHRNFAEIAPRALNILSDLAENAESESVRLGATRDLLDRAGFRPVDRHEIVKEKSVEELNAQLVSLVGENGAEMLISAFRMFLSANVKIKVLTNVEIGLLFQGHKFLNRQSFIQFQ